MPAEDYFAGALLLTVVLGCVVGGAHLLVRARLNGLAGAERVVGFSVIANAGLLAVHLVPLTLGILGRGSVLVAAALWLGLSALVRKAEAEPEAAGPVDRVAEAEPRAARWLALAAVGAVVVFIVAFALDQATKPPTSIDYSNFHLPDVAEWIQHGTLWNISSFIAYLAPGNYPGNGDVALLAFVLPWHNDFATHVPMYAFFALTGVAAFALARRLGAGVSTAAIAGALTCAIPALAIAALTHAITDSVMLFGFTAGVLFLLRHHLEGSRVDLVVAGLALGVSFGTKWYAVSAVAIVVVVWTVARLAAGVRWRQVAGQTLAVSGLIALAGGIWLLRNWVESGNPVFPVRVAPLGILIFDAPPDFVREQAGFTILHYAGDWTALKDWILPAFRDSLAAPSLLLLAGAAAAAIAAVRGAAGRARGVLVVTAAVVVLVVCAYLITPYTAPGPEGFPVLTGANTRYVTPAIVVAGGLAAWAFGRKRWAAVAFGVVGLAAIAHGVYKASRGDLSPAAIGISNWAAAAVVVAIAAAAGWLLASRPRAITGRWRSRPMIAGAVVVALGIVAVVGHEVQRRYNDDRFLGADPVLDAVINTSTEDTRVGLTAVWTDSGISPVLPLFGRRLGNEVEYVGPMVRELQERYPDRESFVAALEAGDFDFLVVGRGRVELPPVQEGRWARSAGWSLAVRSDRLELYTPPV